MNNDVNDIELNIQIDQLVIEGISLTSYQQQRLKESVETELTGLFLTNGIPAGIESAARIKSDAIQLQGQSPTPFTLGKQIAESVYNGLASEPGKQIGK